MSVLKYIFWDNCTKKIRQEKKTELCRNDFIFTKIFELYQVTKLTRYSQKISRDKYFNTLKLYTLKALLSKNLFYFIFFIF